MRNQAFFYGEIMEKYIELMRRIMACKAVTANVEAVNAAESTMRAFLEAEGLHCQMENIDGRTILYASTVPGKVTDVVFNSHLDVVPPSNPDDHILKIDGDTLRGRGTEDCIGNAICCAKIMCELQGKASVGTFFAGDEENGGETTKGMVDRGYNANKIGIVMDGGAFTICTAQKGILVLKFTAQGRAGHSSQPWLFDNAIDKLLDGYAKFKAAWPVKASSRDQWHDTMAPCIIKGGNANNQIPDYAELIVNIRYINADDEEKIIEMAHRTSGLDVSVYRGCQPLYADESNVALIKLKESMQSFFPDQRVTFCHMNGATDARHMGTMGVPIAILGIPGGGAHAASEWASISGIEKYAEFLKKYILAL